jgi:hypothetical protein
MKVRVCDIEVIPPFRKLKFTNKLGQVTFHTLRYQIDFDGTTEEFENLESVPDANNSNKPKEQEKGKTIGPTNQPRKDVSTTNNMTLRWGL